MKIHDITRDLLTAPVFPGDITPTAVSVSSTADGDTHNKVHLLLSSHSGTHIDAPAHFVHGARTIDQMELSRFVGLCTVWETCGEFTVAEIAPVLAVCEKRLIIKGDIVITRETAQAIVDAGILLLGTECLSVGKEGTFTDIHLILLGGETLILENIDLSTVVQGRYTLCALPLKIGGCDGAQCRAVLIED